MLCLKTHGYKYIHRSFAPQRFSSSVTFIRRSLPVLTAAMSTETRSTAIEHFVLLSTKSSTPAPQIDSMVSNLRSLSSLPNVTHLTVESVLRHRSSAAEPFTYVLHGRYPTKTDLVAYSDHPSHLSVVKDNVRPACCDVLALDWVTGSEHGAISPGSAARLTLVKVKEEAGESAKAEILEVMRGAKVKGDVSFGENFAPGRSKGYEIGMLTVFKNLAELDELDNLGEELQKQKDKVRDLIESVIVVDFVVSDPSSNL